MVRRQPSPQPRVKPEFHVDEASRHYERRRPDKFDERADTRRAEQGMALLKAAKNGDVGTLQMLVENGASVNYADPVYRATALHYAAANNAQRVLTALLQTQQCNFLVRDWEGRLPSEIAREHGRNPEMARQLLAEEIRQAQVRGIDPTSLYKVSARKPTS